MEAPGRRMQQPYSRDHDTPAVSDTDNAAPGYCCLHLEGSKHQAAGINASAACDLYIGIRPLGGIEKAGVTRLLHTLKRIADYGITGQFPAADQDRVGSNPQLNSAFQEQSSRKEESFAYQNHIPGYAGIYGVLNGTGAVCNTVSHRSVISDICNTHSIIRSLTEDFFT